MDRTTLREIKRIKSDIDFSIPVKSYDSIIGKLKPITYYDIGNDEMIEHLMNWRNENINAYLSNEKATLEGTRKWLTKFILDNESKILFIVYTDKNEPMGHMGLADGLETNGYVEMDNIVRGVELGKKGMMTLALYELTSWVFLNSNSNKVYLRVFSDNLRAIEMYKRLKFVEKKKYSLKKAINNKMINYSIVKANNVTKKYFSYMELERNDHFENYKNIKNRT